MFQFQMRNLLIIKLACCTHCKHRLPHGFIGERHELPREMRVQLEQSGPMRISPKGTMHKIIHRAVLSFHGRISANMSLWTYLHQQAHWSFEEYLTLWYLICFVFSTRSCTKSHRSLRSSFQKGSSPDHIARHCGQLTCQSHNQCKVYTSWILTCMYATWMYSRVCKLHACMYILWHGMCMHVCC